MLKASHPVEIASVAAIALAILVGGQALLANLARFPFASASLLAVVAVLAVASLWRERRLGTLIPVRAARDSGFVAAAVLALLYVLSPQRWSLGAAVAMVEFALALELVAMIAARRAAR